MQLLRLHLFHLPTRPLASRPVPDLADSREDILLLFPDVPLEARAHRLGLGEPGLLLGVQALHLLDQAFDAADLVLMFRLPSRELRARPARLAREPPVQARVLDMLLWPVLCLQLTPKRAPPVV